MPRATSRPGATALLLHGDERFLVDERARATLDEWGKELVSDFGLDTLEGAGLVVVHQVSLPHGLQDEGPGRVGHQALVRARADLRRIDGDFRCLHRDPGIRARLEAQVADR